MVERRRESRISVSWPLRVAGISGIGEGRIVNASLGGLLFSADVELDVHALAMVKVNLDSETSIDCAVQIVRVDTRHDNRLYAVEIRYMSASDRQRLSFALMMAREPLASGCGRH